MNLSVAISLVLPFTLPEEQWNQTALSSRGQETKTTEKKSKRKCRQRPLVSEGDWSRRHQGYQIPRMLNSHSWALSIR